MTIEEIVEKHGLPVKVQVRGGKRSWEPFTVRQERQGGWYVDYDHKEGTFFVSKNPKLNDYEVVGESQEYEDVG